MNCVSKQLLSGIVYSSDASSVWKDLKERFDKVDGSRIFQLHREIATTTQGTSSIAEYFTKLRLLWAEFDCLAPFPGCNCDKSRDFVEFMKRQKLLQFLIGLNESYEQSRGQILMLVPIPSANQAYTMMIERESQRVMANVARPPENGEMTALMANRSGNFNKFKKNWNAQYDYCKLKGHIKVDCYRLHGYPPDYKFQKKSGNGNTHNMKEGDPRSHGYQMKGEDSRGKAYNVKEEITKLPEGFRGRVTEDEVHKGAKTPHYSQSHYNQMMKLMEKSILLQSNHAVLREGAYGREFSWHGKTVN